MIPSSKQVPSSSRYSVRPTRLSLRSGEKASVIVSVYINEIASAQLPNQLFDCLRLKSAYFEQIVPIKLTMNRPAAPRNRSANQSRSSSPVLLRREQDESDPRQYLQRIMHLEDQINDERQKYEENSFKVMHILRQKDSSIAQLRSQLDAEIQSHLATKEQLVAANTRVNAFRDSSVQSAVMSERDESEFAQLERQNEQLALESHQLRERCIDQSEQIQVRELINHSLMSAPLLIAVPLRRR